jgi:light-regulated signal transduction histidine kinase (bacteriophytochrome)
MSDINNNPMSKNIAKDLQNNLLFELLTHFVCELEGNLNINNNNYETLNKLSLHEVQNRLNEVLKRVKILKEKSQNNNVNNLIKQLNKENDNLSNEIDNFFN